MQLGDRLRRLDARVLPEVTPIERSARRRRFVRTWWLWLALPALWLTYATVGLLDGDWSAAVALAPPGLTGAMFAAVLDEERVRLRRRR